MTEIDQPTDIHTFFSLTYSNYLVLHRTLLQSMPEEWQHRFVAIVTEMNEAFDHIEQAESYIVTAAEESTYSDLSDEQLTALGITADKPEGDYETYWHGGREHEPDDAILVPLPGGDPVPSYDRGRTHIEPATVEPTAPDEEPEPNLGGCPYYLTRGLPDSQRGVCDSGCREEPNCITSEPEGGWPDLPTPDEDSCPASPGGVHCTHRMTLDDERCCHCKAVVDEPASPAGVETAGAS